MKSTVLNRIMDKSPADSLAALATRAFIRTDNNEMSRIFGAVAGKERAERYDFFIRHHAMIESLLLWAVEYWKTVATFRACLVVTLAPDIADKESTIATLMLNAQKAKLVTLIEAMRQICTKAGIDFDEVAAFAEVDTDIDEKPIPKLIPEYVEMFGIAG